MTITVKIFPREKYNNEVDKTLILFFNFEKLKLIKLDFTLGAYIPHLVGSSLYIIQPC